ncbi:MAG: PTS system mannose/fructose/sorbose family transporter subunit IID [Lachnospiraceae bacterium]|nr:PTS system mannose/fructose/sorbose family transporter subunit IID [Lachnospiraceae bacterium]
MSSKIHADYNGIITKKDLRKVFWRSIPMEHAWNYERMMHSGYCFAMLPVLKKLYPKKEDYIDALKRHMELYNVTPYISTLPLGISVAMEEKRAEDPGNFDTDSISNVKTAFMGPLSGIGDAIYWGTIRIIAMSIGVSLAIKGSILGPILFWLTFNIPNFGIRYIMTFLGYKFGAEVTTKLEASGMMEKVMRAASILGLTVAGALTAEMVYLSIPIQIGMGEETTTIQEILDGIVPGLLPLALFGIVYVIFKKKKCSPIVMMFILMALGIAGAYFGFLG